MEESKFNLWRATFSFCFVDGFLSSEESAFVEEKIKALPFSSEQRKILMGDLLTPPSIDSLLPLITTLADRGFLINNIRLLSHIDNLTPIEKTRIDHLLSEVMKKIDPAASTKAVEGDKLSTKKLYSEAIINKLMRK